jgi:hypothetical protein
MINTNKTYVGVVEDNNDPKKLGRVKVRVMDVYEDISLEDIPWASPWKDLNGNTINIPDKGKVVLVVFEQDNLENPEYIFADHYNVNLENKLKSLSNDDYISMKSLLFDHKTQIYVNDNEGLKIDHKYNNINLKESSIDINLKDNNTILNIGDSTADQQAVLGNHFMNWLDKFVDAIMRGGLLDVKMAPITPSPSLLPILLEFKALKDIKFLSQHVNVVDNNKVITTQSIKRESKAQYGDEWKSTKKDNDISVVKDESFEPKDGIRDDGSIASQDGGVNDIADSSSGVVERLRKYMKMKGFIINESVNTLNIVAMRKSNGDLTNMYDDILYVFYKNSSNIWILNTYNISTVPSYPIVNKKLSKPFKVMAFGQYINGMKLNNDKFIIETAKVYRSEKIDSYEYTKETMSVVIILRSSSNSSEFNTNIESDHVFKSKAQFESFKELCVQSNSKTFTYTLCLMSEFDKVKVDPIKPRVFGATNSSDNLLNRALNLPIERPFNVYGGGNFGGGGAGGDW